MTSTFRAVPVLAVILCACGGDAEQAPEGEWRAAIDTIGDTIVVHTLGGSVWGDTVELVEELSIGTLNGPTKQIFGQINDIAPDATGGVYVFDGSVPALRYYDATGEYVRTLGREGAGPGEYGDAALGLAVLRDGRILLHDIRNTRLIFYQPDGTPVDHWRVGSGLFTGDAMLVDTAGHVYLKVLLGPIERGKPWPIGFMHLDTMGTVVDSIAPPRLENEPDGAGGMFEPKKVWDMGPTRVMVAGVSDDYSFNIYRPDGSVVRVQKEHETVRLHPDERAEYEARREWLIRTQGEYLTAEPAPIGESKPPYKSLEVDAEGHVWVWLHTPAVKIEGLADDSGASGDRPPPLTWREPVVYDVFESDGTYLGVVRFPKPRTRAAAFRATPSGGSAAAGSTSSTSSDSVFHRYAGAIPSRRCERAPWSSRRTRA